MDFGFLFTQNSFHAFSSQHLWPMFLITLVGAFLIYLGTQLKNKTDRHNLFLYISLVPATAVLIQIFIPIADGSFSAEEDLPFHVCRFVALVAPVAVYKMNKFWLGIFYFWILAGTLNANITPDITYGFPHINYFCYWAVHSFLVILPIYYIVVFKVHITLKDLSNAFWMANLFLVFSLVVNMLLGSNYMYSRHKPPVESLMDYLGPWPIYLISGQLFAGLLFAILFIPFLFKKEKT